MKFYKEFDDYVNNFDLSDKDINLKYNHSYRVMNLANKYSKLLGFSDHDVEVATLIGLLHDIGRFKQLNDYHTYNDFASMDHGDYGVKLLFEDNLIEKFWDNKDDYETIKFAIKNHNKFKIPENNDKRMMMHAKLIRDIDKLDIIYLEGKLDLTNTRVTNDEVTKEVLEEFKNHKNVKYENMNNSNDYIVLFYSFVFDINNDIVLEEYKRNVKWYYEMTDKDHKFKDIYDEVIKYIDERVDKYVRN